jgi:phosphoglycolate phosphatase-like HAD superfamily hydrolase
MSTRSVLFDLDGTLCDLHRESIALINNSYGTNLTLGNVIEWDYLIHKVLRLSEGQKSYDSTYNWLFGTRAMQNAQPTPGSQQMVERLAGLDFSLHVATSRRVEPPNDDTEVTIEWLENHFPQIQTLTIGGDRYGFVG